MTEQVSGKDHCVFLTANRTVEASCSVEGATSDADLRLSSASNLNSVRDNFIKRKDFISV